MFIFALKIDQNLNKHGNHKKKEGKRCVRMQGELSNQYLKKEESDFIPPLNEKLKTLWKCCIMQKWSSVLELPFPN